MKNTNLATAVGMTTLLCVGITASGYAQQGAGGGGRQGGRGHGGQQMPRQMEAPTPVILKAGDNGVFSIQDGSLLKLDPDSMKQIKSLLLADYVGKPEDGMIRPPRHRVPASMSYSNGKVLVVIGDQFYSVDAKSMKLTAKASFQLPRRGMNMDQPGMGQQGRRGPGGPEGQQMNGRRGPGGPEGQQMNGRRGPDGPEGQQMNGRRGPGGPEGEQMNGRCGPGGPEDEQMNGRRSPGGPEGQQMNGRRGHGGPRGHMAPPPATIEVHGDTATIVAGPHTIAVDINSGKVLSTSELPEPEDK